MVHRGYSIRTLMVWVSAAICTSVLLRGSGRFWRYISLRRPPGPKSRSPLGYLLSLSERTHLQLLQWQKEYGNFFCFRISRRCIYVAGDPAIFSFIFSNPQIFPQRYTTGIKFFIPLSLLGLDTNDMWKTHRTILSGAFTDAHLKNYSRAIVEKGAELTALFSTKNSPEKEKEGYIVEDLNEFMSTTTYTVLASTVMGKDWLRYFPQPGTKEEVKAMLMTANLLTPFPEWAWKYVSVPGKKLAVSVFTNKRRIAQEMIRKLRANREEGSTMYHFLVNQHPHLSDDEMIDELFSLVMAGHETTANTLSFAIISLALNPTVQEMARKEVRRSLAALAAAKGQGGSTGQVQLEYESVHRLPFVWCIFRETLRLFPTVPVLPRVAAKDAEINGFKIPTGANVLLNFLAVGRDPTLFPDPTSFNPCRWIPDRYFKQESAIGHHQEQQQIDTTHSTSSDRSSRSVVDLELPSAVWPELKDYDMQRNFGGGLRQCLGKRFAEEESVLLLAILISRFQFELVAIDGESPAVLLGSNAESGANPDLTRIPTLANITLTFEKKMSVRFTPD